MKLLKPVSLQVRDFQKIDKNSKIYSVGSATYKGGAHAMVLDTIKNDTFVFKNTYEEEKQVEIPMDHEDAPDEFFFVHINYKKTN